MRQIAFTFLILFTVTVSVGQGINYAHQYNLEGEFWLEYRTVYNPATITVMMNIASADSLTNFEAILDFRNSYSDTKSDSSASVFLDQALFDARSNTWALDLTFDKVGMRRLLLVQFVHKTTGMSYSYDVPLEWYPDMNQPSTVLYDTTLNHPKFTSYINTDFPLKTDQRAWVTYFNVNYGPASPPMSAIKGDITPELTIDSTFAVLPNTTFSLHRDGIYFFEQDTYTNHGIAFCVHDAPFPKYASIEELIEPMRYVCTNKEYQQLKSNPGKATFEKVWLDITDDEGRAREIIRNYFNRVELANRLFTTFKEGWKTDMGMIYIVFGTPDEVYKSNGKEEWIYAGKNNRAKQKFTFNAVKNVFTAKHYTLQRNSSYKSAWLYQVDLWRKNRVK